MDIRIKDITGQKFNKLTVIEYAGRRESNRNSRWLCLCECGNTVTVDGSTLRLLRQKSCGCARKKRFMPKIHGLCASSEYSSWKGMHTRCYNKTNHKYPIYGGRGITVCPEWHDAKAFLDDMGKKPTKHHSINRKDNDGNYTPENCEWATPKEQANNKRTNRIIKHNGLSMTVSQWADHLNISFVALRMRLHRGWGITKSFNTPINYRR